jgi:hypothetical protein
VLATLIGGQVADDLDGSGSIDESEPGLAGVTVYVDANGNDMLDIVGQVLEPDDFASGELIDGSALGVTLALADNTNTPKPGAQPIVARDDTFASTGSRVFAHQVNFFDSEDRLRIDFASPVSAVQINFTGTRPFAGQAGHLEAYSADGTLIDSYITGQLLQRQYETMAVESDQPNIAYVSAYTGTTEQITGRLDSLRIDGLASEIWTLTNTDGNYTLSLPGAGTYSVKQIVPEGYVQTLPGGGAGRDVQVGSNQTVAGADFADQAAAVGSWQNQRDPLDVDDDLGIFPLDALLIINELNQPFYSNPADGKLPPPPDPVPQFLDVDGDGYVSPNDAVLVINFLNSDQNPNKAVVAEAEPAGGAATGTPEVQPVESLFGDARFDALIAAAVAGSDEGASGTRRPS